MAVSFNYRLRIISISFRCKSSLPNVLSYTYLESMKKVQIFCTYSVCFDNIRMMKLAFSVPSQPKPHCSDLIQGPIHLRDLFIIFLINQSFLFTATIIFKYIFAIVRLFISHLQFICWLTPFVNLFFLLYLHTHFIFSNSVAKHHPVFSFLA